MRRMWLLAVAAAILGLLVAAGAAEASTGGNSGDENRAELIAAGFFALLTLLLYVAGRKVHVTTRALDDIEVDTVKRSLVKGAIVDDATVAKIEAGAVAGVGASALTVKRFSLLHYLLVGKDNRTSTSKVIVFAWTYAIAWALLAMLVAKWLGDPAAWEAQVYGKGIQEEYLIFLGGPYAAAIFAKYRHATGDTAKTDAPVGDQSRSSVEGARQAIKEVVADDRGEGDLIDFQYVLFNALALAFFLGVLIPDMDGGFPEMPELLAVLALVSVGGYGAKKAVALEKPRLISLFPTTIEKSPDAEVDIWGRNLVVAGAAGQDAKPPIVTIGSHDAKVTMMDATLGTEKVKVKLPTGVTAGEHPVRALRADGVPAQTETGTGYLTLTVTAPPARQESSTPPGGETAAA